jgi:hypothetical protein
MLQLEPVAGKDSPFQEAPSPPLHLHRHLLALMINLPKRILPRFINLPVNGDPTGTSMAYPCLQKKAVNGSPGEQVSQSRGRISVSLSSNLELSPFSNLSHNLCANYPIGRRPRKLRTHSSSHHSDSPSQFWTRLCFRQRLRPHMSP